MDELYPQSFIDGLNDPEPWENPWLVGILKFEHNRPLKVSIEKWYGELPDEIKPRFTSKLRSLDDSEFISAVYELIAHQYCIEEGWTVEYEPNISQGSTPLTPDFVVTTQSGQQFVLEVATLFESREIATGLRLRRELNRRISGLESRYGLTISYRDMPTQGANAQRATREVAEWLASIAGDDSRQSQVFQSNGFNFEVEIDPRFAPGANGSVVAITSGGYVPNYSGRIQSILKAKSTKYSSKKTGMPLVVIMAGGGEMINTDFMSVDRAVYGWPVVQVPIDGNGASQSRRDESGLFTPKREHGEVIYRNTGISAVVYTRLTSEYEGGLNRVQMLTLHHLNPHMGLPSEIFAKLPQYQVISKDDRHVTMEWSIEDHENHRIGFSY